MLGREIYTVENKQTGTLGCAVLGSVAAGDYGSVEEAVKAMVRPGLIYEPQERRSRFYREKFALCTEVLSGFGRTQPGVMILGGRYDIKLYRNFKICEKT